MTSKSKNASPDVIGIKVNQWLKEWNSVKFSADERRRRPEPQFYLFSLSASELRALAGIYRRTTARGQLRSDDTGIQRRHDESRSAEISRFVRYGYPWSNLNKSRRASGEFRELRKPGWLPTAVVVNILRPDDERRDSKVYTGDLITVVPTGDRLVSIKLPRTFSGADWKPKYLHPIEVIDGQHRLWAFDDSSAPEDYELPVVAFYGLDISWQAYLFWTINIKPKRINPSLAFDLYPLLRTEDWLDRFEGSPVYRETRAQELTEILWSQPESPWHHRINMLGESGTGMVSQAGWIRSLLATYVRSFGGQGVKIGGLFGAPVGADRLVLPWSRQQQGAYLIALWQKFQEAVRKSGSHWAQELRVGHKSSPDPAFYGQDTLLNQDQGVRAFMQVTNDLAFIRHEELKLSKWSLDTREDDDHAVSEALKSIPSLIDEFLGEIADSLAQFDWRSSTADGLTDDEKIKKLVFRGSGGYTEFRRQLIRHVAKSAGQAGRAAKLVLRQEQSR